MPAVPRRMLRGTASPKKLCWDVRIAELYLPSCCRRLGVAMFT
jgi:hypothetical protein